MLNAKILLTEFGVEAVEALERGRRKARHRGADCFKWLGAVEACLRIKFVGVAYQPFEQGLGRVVAHGHRQMHRGDIVGGDAGAGVPFGHAGDLLGNAFAAEQGGAEYAVADVRLSAVAVDAVGIGHEDADVVEHGRALDRVGIKTERFRAVDLQGEARDLTAVA